MTSHSGLFISSIRTRAQYSPSLHYRKVRCTVAQKLVRTRTIYASAIPSSTRLSVPAALVKDPPRGYSMLRPAYLRARFDAVLPDGPNGTSIAALCPLLERGSTFQYP